MFEKIYKMYEYLLKNILMTKSKDKLYEIMIEF